MQKLNGVFDNLDTMQREAWTNGELSGQWPAAMCTDGRHLLRGNAECLKNPGARTRLAPHRPAPILEKMQATT